MDSRHGAACHTPASPSYFFPYQVLSRLFRGKFLAGLADAYRSGKLVRETLPEPWRKPPDSQQRYRELARCEWVVYQEAPPPGLEPAALVKYLARYVSGMAISDRRLVSCENGRVSFTIKDRQTGRSELRHLNVEEFLSRFLQHVLPPGLTRIRYFGFWSTNNAAQRELCRQLLRTDSGDAPLDLAAPEPPSPEPSAPELPDPTGAAPVKRQQCPSCHKCSFVLMMATFLAKWRVHGAPLWTPGVPLPRPQWSRPQPELFPTFLSVPLTLPSARSDVAVDQPSREIRRDSS